MDKIKIIIADKQELFRKSLAALLQNQAEFEVLADVATGKELAEELKQKAADIVLLDVEMPVMDGKKVFQIMKNRFPQVRAIVLNAQPDVTLASYFIMHGAGCYLSRNCEVQTLFKAIRAVKEEGCFFDSFSSRALVDAAKDKAYKNTGFNDRETEIIKNICDGKTHKEIASDLNLSISTIDFHKGKIYSKANCSSATALFRYAVKNGIVAIS